jgi:hypothetical protein
VILKCYVGQPHKRGDFFVWDFHTKYEGTSLHTYGVDQRGGKLRKVEEERRWEEFGARCRWVEEGVGVDIA